VTSPSDEVLDPPVIDTLPGGLPPPQDVEGGVFLPTELAEALDREREQGLACPDACKVLLLSQKELDDARASRDMKKREATLRALHEKELANVESKGFSLLEVIGIAGCTAATTTIVVVLSIVLGA